MSGETKPQTVSAEELRHIIGDVDAATVASILQTGATAAEVVEAYTWLNADDDLGPELGHTRSGAVGAVYEILAAIEPEDC